MSSEATAAQLQAQEDEAAKPRLTHRQILVILSGLLAGMFLAALDQTIVGTSIRTIADDLQGYDLQAWATTAYLITATISTPLYGKLSDIYGRKPFFITAISIFLIGSLACTFAQSMYQLAAFRAVQGLGAGGLMSLALTILGDIVPPRERAKYQGYFLAVWGTSSVLGPVLGGFLAGQSEILSITGWRWVFLVNVPIGAIALFVVSKVLNVPHQRQDHRIDYWGAATLTLGLVPLLIVAEQGQKWGWGANRSLACFVVGGIGVLLFLWVENRMRDEALIPLRLFRNSTFSLSIVVGTIIGIGMFGGIVMLPQYLQVVHGATPTESGLMMLPLMIGIMTGSIVSGQITSRTGRYKIFPVIGTGLLVVGLLLFWTITVDTPLWQLLSYMLVFGLGLGNCMQTLVIAAQNAVPMRDMGVATASSTFFRQIGGTMGVAIFLSVLFSTVVDNIKSAFTDAAANDTGFQTAIQDPAVRAAGNNQKFFEFLSGKGAGLDDTSFLQLTDPRLARPFEIGFTNSITLVFLIGAGVMVLAFVTSWFMKEIPLRTGGAPAAATLEGGESLLPTEPPTPDAPDTGNGYTVRSAEETGPISMGAPRHSIGGSNGQSGTQTAVLTAPVSTVADMQVDERAGTDLGVRGSVLHRDGSPVERAVLTLIDHGGRQVGRGTVGPDGGYSMTATEPGTYVLIAAAPGHRPQASSVAIRTGSSTVDITLTGSGEVAGTVTDADGQPLARATVTLADGRGEVVGSGTSATNGTFRLTGVSAGDYTLVVGAQGCLPYAGPLTVRETGVVRHDVQLTGGGQLTGVATNHLGRVVPDARITVVDAEGTVLTVTTTDDDGRYVVTDLPDGDYTVIASGYAPSAHQLGVRSGEHTTQDVVLGYGQWD